MAKLARTPRRYGLDPSTTIDEQRLSRDVRPLTQQIADIFVEPVVPATLMVMLMVVVLLFPTFLYVAVPLALWVRWLCKRHPDVLPMNLPEEAKSVDLNDPKPGRKAAYKARGKVFLGRDMDWSWELWTTFNVLLRHLTYFGTTGSGKSEALLSLYANFLGFGGSCVYNDAKGTMKLVWQSYTISRYFGRDDDFNTLNYVTGNASTKSDPALRMSNDTNPFAVGAADSLVQMMMGLLPGSGPNDPNKLFSERAIALISAMMPALVELRNKGLIYIDPGVIRRYMEFAEFISLSTHPGVSAEAREPIFAYTASLSGYDPNKSVDKQSEEIFRQFGFAQAYFTRALSSLSDTYGDIYMTQMGEISFTDVVLNNRNLVTILPAMEKSDEELSNLGKINFSALRNAMSLGLGSRLEGSRAVVLDSLATATPYPTGIIIDEAAYQAVPGIAITAAQARGLNFCMVFASQEMSSLTRVLDKEAYQLIANTRIKVVMALEDAGETIDLIYKLVGEARRYQSDGHKIGEGAGFSYYDNMSASAQMVKRIDLMDLRGLNEGEAFIIYQDKVIRTSLFWHGFSDDDLITTFEVHRRMKVRASDRGLAKVRYSRMHAEYQRIVDTWLKYIEPGELDLDTPPPAGYVNACQIIEKAKEHQLSNMDTIRLVLAYFGGGPVDDDTETGSEEEAKKAEPEDTGPIGKAPANTLLGSLTADEPSELSGATIDEPPADDEPAGSTASTKPKAKSISSTTRKSAAPVDAKAAVGAASAALDSLLDFDDDDPDSADENVLSAAESTPSLLDDADTIADETGDPAASSSDSYKKDLGIDEDEEEEAPLFKRVPFVPDNEEAYQALGDGIEHLERIRGESLDIARRSSENAIKAVRRAIEYPTVPLVTKGKDFGVESVADTLDRWLNES